MNRSKKIVGVIVILLVVLYSLFLPLIPGMNGEKMSYDAVHVYANCIETESVTNWHSSLFMYECIVVKRILDLLFRCFFSGHAVLCIFWCFSTLMMVAAIVFIGCQLVEKTAIWCVLYPCAVYASLKLPLAHLYQCGVGLDYFFVCVLWCFLASMLAYNSSITHSKKIIWLAVVLLILLHLVSFRRNSVFIVPLGVACIMYGFESFNKLRLYHKIGLWVASSMLCSFFALVWADAILPVKKLHPVAPMMESEVRIAAILRGEADAYRQQGLIATKGEDAERCISAYWYGSHDWEKLSEIYIDEWRANTETMLTAALIQRVQFFSGGNNFDILKKVVESRFPAVVGNERAWLHVTPVLLEGPLVRLLWLSLSPCLVIAVVLVRKYGKISFAICFVSVVSALVSLLYAGSFLVVVPTSDARYLAPAYMMALLSGLLFAGMLIEMIGKKVMKRSNAC